MVTYFLFYPKPCCYVSKKMDYRYRTYDPNEWKLYQAYLHLKKLPKFDLTYTPDVPDDDVSSDFTSETSVKKRVESRGGGKGKKAAIADKLKEVKADRKRSRDGEKGGKLDMMMTEMTEINKIMKKKSAATIITKALKDTDYE